MLSYTHATAGQMLHNEVSPMTTPAEFDLELNTHPWDEVYARAAGNPARQALAAVYSRDPAVIQTALSTLNGNGSPLAYGARMVCLMTLGRHQQVLQEYRQLLGADSETIEAQMHALVAASVAAGEVGHPSVAISQMHAAGVLAGLLGAAHRHQWILIEQERLLLPQGLASAERVQAALDLVPARPGRLAYASQIAGAALLAHGEYAQAAAHAGGGVQALSLAMQHGVIAQASPDSSYGSVALAAQELIQGHDPSAIAATVTSDPEALYGWAFCAIWALRSGQFPPMRATPVIADQQVVWALLSWEALHQGDVRQSAEAIVSALRDGLRGLTSFEVLEIMADYAPVALAALLRSPLAGLVSGTRPHQGVLLGEHIELAGVLHKLPGKTGGGQALLMQALGREWPISRVERSRLRQAIADLRLNHPLVYATDLVRALAILEPGGGSAWRDAARAVTSTVDARAIRRELIALHDLTAEMHA